MIELKLALFKYILVRMRKPILPRFAGLAVLYAAVFVLLAALQFTQQRNFTQKIGLMTVSGRLGEAGIRGGTYFLNGDTSVFFGGLEFRLDGGGRGAVLAGSSGGRRNIAPESVVIQDTIGDKTAVFHFPGNGALSFSIVNGEAGPELRISGEFGAAASAIEIPYRFMRNARSQDGENGGPLILWEGGHYSFGESPLDEDRRLLLLENPAFTAAYGAIPDLRPFDPAAYVLQEAQSGAQYREILAQWRQDASSRWNAPGPGSWRNSLDEELITASIAEAALQGTYRSAVAGVSAQFRQAQTYRSSVYLGALSAALESMLAFEQERTARLSQTAPLGLLEAYRFIEFWAIRGDKAAIDAGAALIRGIDADAVGFERLPGVLEGYVDWLLYRSPEDNPFADLIEPALASIAQEIRRENSGVVFAAPGGLADLELNLRLGLALDSYGTRGDQQKWAALGRSLVLSVLAQTGPSGDFPQALRITAGGLEAEGAARISAARLYRYISAPAYPHAAALNAGNASLDGIWAWTAADSIQTVSEPNALDIAITFPVDETHYLLIRGLPQFSRLQLYGMDFRTAPEFETYDSSGWVYSAANQTLLLKMKHRTPVEHVKIFWR